MGEFARKNRLSSQRDFRYVWENPKKVRSEQFLIFFRPNQNDYSRIGIVIKKSSLKLAQQRNLLRRVVRESFRAHLPMLKELDIVVLARPSKYPLNKKIIREGIDQLWQKVLISASKPV
ncbi:MAG: ribonuclease P protein component [Gammaproteobacteria bacterium]|nr:ribonuclease P protein component [Gammaproteobacteria bacterium]